ncbi:unnamed protein product [Toxocara canis]|uniref:Kinesin motor domain-containing protein n=1 Tax=Toxocara canis TaxID=6265 RepID=A0A183UUU5_TOXCA|nr:unnamed protein product [Toxocara canis]
MEHLVTSCNFIIVHVRLQKFNPDSLHLRDELGRGQELSADNEEITAFINTDRETSTDGEGGVWGEVGLRAQPRTNNITMRRRLAQPGNVEKLQMRVFSELIDDRQVAQFGSAV